MSPSIYGCANETVVLSREWNSTCTSRNANKLSEIMTTSSIELRCAVPPHCGEPPSQMPTGIIFCIPAVPTHTSDRPMSFVDPANQPLSPTCVGWVPPVGHNGGRTHGMK